MTLSVPCTAPEQSAKAVQSQQIWRSQLTANTLFSLINHITKSRILLQKIFPIVSGNFSCWKLSTNNLWKNRFFQNLSLTRIKCKDKNNDLLTICPYSNLRTYVVIKLNWETYHTIKKSFLIDGFYLNTGYSGSYSPVGI